jgi:AcrR family transcriptional regulator
VSVEASKGRRPRTQAERRAATTEALLDATIECLVLYGYAGTTTGRVAERAGVTRGAQIPYFPTRADLVGAALVRLADQRVAAVQARFEGRVVSVPEALDVLWDEHQGAAFEAALELWVASRTDPALRRKLHGIERDVGATIVGAAAAALGDRAQRPGFTDDVLFALATVRGLALVRISDGSSGRTVDERWQQCRGRLARLLT